MSMTEEFLIAHALNPENTADVFSRVTAEDFQQPAARIMADAITELMAENRSTDVITVAEHLEAKGYESPTETVMQFSEMLGIGSARNIDDYAANVRSNALRARMTAAITSAQRIIADEDPESALSQIESLFQSLETGSDESVWDMKSACRAFFEEMERRVDAGGEILGLTTGFRDLDDRLSGLRGGDFVVIAGRPSMGKAQPLNSKVLMADGNFKPMGEIAVGDAVASPDGAQSTVSGVFPQGVRPIYGIELSDGREVECDEDHLWTIESSRFLGARTVTTSELQAMLTKERYHNRVRLVSHNGEFGSGDLPIDPWLTGFLVGDGGLAGSSVRFSTGENYILDKVAARIPGGCSVKHVSRCDYRIVSAGFSNPVARECKAMGINTLSHEKKLPDSVFSADRETREQVLLGLIESDGWSQNSSLQFSSSSKVLAEQYQRLVRSLGGVASYRNKSDVAYVSNGATVRARDAHIISASFPEMNRLIESKRVSRHLTERRRTTQPVVRSVAYRRQDRAQCIKVTHPSSLYITDGYVVTHNTTLAVNIAEHNAIRLNKPSVVFSMEMAPTQVTEKITASQGGIDLGALRRGMLDNDQWSRFSAASSRISRAPLFIDGRGGLTVSQVRARCHKIKQKHGLELAVIDYIGLMRGEGGNRNEQLTNISAGIKAMAKDLDIPVIVLSQLNRAVEQRADKRPAMSDLRESGALEQDADIILFPYRDEYYNPDTDHKGVVELNCAKLRMGEIGITGLRWEGKYSRFEELDYQPDFGAKKEQFKPRGQSQFSGGMEV